MSDETRLMELVARYVEGVALREEVQELESALRSDAELRRNFLRYMNVDAALGGASGMRRSMAVENTRAASVGRIIWLRRMAIAAAAALLLWLGALWLGSNRTRAAAPFATLITTTNARWSDPNVELALNSGEKTAGALRLESGHAEFQMIDGATVVLDGPATVRFAERKVVVVDEGRVFCKCPVPQSRLSVVTPQTRVVDLGTEFSVDVRADESTRVAVLSGKVDVKSPNAGVLTAGEVMDVKRDQVVRLKPLTADEIAVLAREALPSALSSSDRPDTNRLTDSGFEKVLPSAIWRGTDDCLEHVSLGRSGHAVRIRAQGRYYPLVKQRVATGDTAGQIVQASVWAMSPADDPVSSRQFAVLKLAFLNDEGREFACSTRHFLHKGQPANVYVPAQLAAQAPPGTRSVEVQLMLGAGRETSGSVCFDDASLVIAGDSAK